MEMAGHTSADPRDDADWGGDPAGVNGNDAREPGDG